MRRHPDAARLVRGFPGGGQYDVLWIAQVGSGGGRILLNRHGTIQIGGRFDGGEVIEWRPTEWSEYAASDPLDFVESLEAGAGLPSPKGAPAATPVTLTYRVLASVAAAALKSVHPVEIEPGFIDSSGLGGGPNEKLRAFSITDGSDRAREDDLFGEPGYRFWIVTQHDKPLFVIEQAGGVVWFARSAERVDLVARYRQNRRSVVLTAAQLLAQAGGKG